MTVFNVVWYAALATFVQILVADLLGFVSMDLVALSFLMLVPAIVLACVLDSYSIKRRKSVLLWKVL